MRGGLVDQARNVLQKQSQSACISFLWSLNSHLPKWAATLGTGFTQGRCIVCYLLVLSSCAEVLDRRSFKLGVVWHQDDRFSSVSERKDAAVQEQITFSSMPLRTYVQTLLKIKPDIEEVEAETDDAGIARR